MGNFEGCFDEKGKRRKPCWWGGESGWRERYRSERYDSPMAISSVTFKSTLALWHEEGRGVRIKSHRKSRATTNQRKNVDRLETG